MTDLNTRLEKIIMGVWFDGAYEHGEGETTQGTPISPDEAIDQIHSAIRCAEML